LLVVSAPSGAGKSTLVKRLLAARPEARLSVSHTTRAPRPGERDGVDYCFTTPETFVAMLERSEFLEHANVYGNWYGTSRAEVDRLRAQGLHAVLDIDVQGARQLRELAPHAVSIFILPPSLEVLAARLRGRKTESEDAIIRRLAQARRELEQAPEYDYIVVNDDLDACTASLLSVLDAELLRAQRSRDKVAALLRE
jgi:guanylate kinase